ncbi:MAG: hypothetical protein K8I27_14580 [Planctomycetes bacterium]|nr:hypothetical protein [Planctomycetota bacterium]
MKAQTEKIAKASPCYARLLNSVQRAELRRRELARFLTTRRTRFAFEDALRQVGTTSLAQA